MFRQYINMLSIGYNHLIKETKKGIVTQNKCQIKIVKKLNVNTTNI